MKVKCTGKFGFKCNGCVFIDAHTKILVERQPKCYFPVEVSTGGFIIADRAEACALAEKENK